MFYLGEYQHEAMGPPFVFLIIIWGLLSIFQTRVSGQDVHKLARFEDWIRTNAWMHSNITLSGFPQGNGLKAISVLPENTRILTIPFDLQISRVSMISSLRSRASERSLDTYAFMENMNDLEDAEIVSVGMLTEDCFHEKSRLYPYLSILSLEAPPLLFTWDQKELDHLQDDQLIGLATETARRLEYVWDTLLQSQVLQSIVTNPSCLSLASFRRYYAITLSHSMWLPDHVLRIVPMAEQINHAPSNQSSSLFSAFHTRNEEDGSISVFVDRLVEAGEQILEEYDRLDNSLHLLQFGFVSTDNPHHCVVLYLAPPEANWDGTACVRHDFTCIFDEQVDQLIAKYTDNSRCLENLRSFDELGIQETCSNSVSPRVGQRASATLDPELVRNAARRDPRSDSSLLKNLEQELERVEDGSTLFETDANPKRLALALRFRLEDAKLVIQLAERQTANEITTRDEL